MILLDLNMPAGTGQSVLHAIRARPDTAGIPVIVLTGLDEPRLEKEVLSQGAQGFIRKPYDPEELLDMILTLISASA